MFTLINYLEYYKNQSFNDTKFNQMDALLFSCLAYLPLASFDKPKNIKEFISYANTFKRDDLSGTMKPSAYLFLDKIKTSKRYQNIIITNFENTRNENTQFGAMCIHINDDILIVFNGTDGSLIGWIENLRLNYKYPTYTQSKAIDYVNKNITDKTNRIYIAGHSKGGNLAMCAAMELPDNKLKKVEKIYNFDGPGFLKNEYENKFTKIKNKVVNIVPTGSVVGMCLYNDNYEVVKSKNLAISEHYPTSWTTYGEFFINGKLSKVSTQIHEITTVNMESINKKELEKAIENFCEGLGKDYNSELHLNVTEIWEIIKNMQDIDPEVYKFLSNVIYTIMKIK